MAPLFLDPFTPISNCCMCLLAVVGFRVIRFATGIVFIVNTIL